MFIAEKQKFFKLWHFNLTSLLQGKPGRLLLRRLLNFCELHAHIERHSVCTHIERHCVCTQVPLAKVLNFIDFFITGTSHVPFPDLNTVSALMYSIFKICLSLRTKRSVMVTVIEHVLRVCTWIYARFYGDDCCTSEKYVFKIHHMLLSAGT